MKPAITVENLSKMYRLGVQQANRLPGSHRTLREAIMESLITPWRRRRRPATLAAPAPAVPSLRALAPSPSVASGNGRADPADAEEPDASIIWALKKVSFEVQHGEVVGFIGANGSGKSTLLKILAGVVEPTEGRATITGRVGCLLEVGTGFHPDLTGRENIYLNGAILGMPHQEIERKFDDIVDFSELHRFLDTPVKRYSSGMYVRLAFAVAAHLEPDVLLVDEVLAVGDSAFTRKCLKKMGSVAQEGITVVFISHDTLTVQKLCKRVFLLVDGKIERQGEGQKVVAAYEGKSQDVNKAVESGDGSYELSQHKARSMIYDPILRRLKIHGGDGQSRPTYYPKETICFDLFLEPLQPLRKPQIAIAIEDHFGRRVMTLSTRFDKEKTGPITSATCFRCVLPDLRIGPGRYLLSLGVWDDQEVLDALENACWFEVGWQDDYYPSGEPHHPAYGPVLASSHWQRLD